MLPFVVWPSFPNFLFYFYFYLKFCIKSLNFSLQLFFTAIFFISIAFAVSFYMSSSSS